MKKPTDEEYREILAAVERCGSITAAAAEAGIARQTMQDKVRNAKARLGDNTPKMVEYPKFVTEGDEDEPIEDILDRKSRHFERKVKAGSDRDWFQIKVNEEKPYGIIAFGDEHLDDDGANIPLIRKHLAIAAKPNVYGISIGDVRNNWIGRLVRLYANQEASAHTARRLVDWFMNDCGVSWLAFIAGNHDAWGDGIDFLMRLANRKIPVLDWKAQFALVHPSGTTCRIDASHGRKGSSQWNALHATLKAAKLGELADAYLTGHTHNYGCEDLEVAERKYSTWLVQLRGYKFFDSHALYNNFAEYQRGSSVFMLVDPSPNATRPIIQCFEDVDLGYRVMRMLRGESCDL